MGKKSQPAPPPAPNPVVVAGEQQKLNDASARMNAEINRFDEFTPYGASTWHKDPTSDKWTRINQLDPQDQQMLDMQRGIGIQGLDVAGQQFGKVADMLSTPISTQGLPDRVSSLPAPQLQKNIRPSGTIRRGFGDAGPIQRSVDFGDIQGQVGEAGPIQKSVQFGDVQQGLDFSGVDPINRDFSGERNRVEQALYDRNTQFMDERFGQDKERMLSDLRARGITEGSEAWTREVDRAERNRDAAYEAARNQAIIGGGQEQSRLFGQDLAARQQGVGELAQQGSFANQAQAQAAQQALAGGSFANQAQQQALQQDLARGGFANQAQAQAAQQALAGGGFANQAQQQAQQQAMQDAAFANTAQQQQFGQNVAQMEALNNALQGQFGLAASAADFQNAQRAGQLAENAYFRNQPMNELSALMNMSPIQGPNAQNIAQVGTVAPDYQGQVNANFAQQSQNWQQQNAARNSLWGDIFGAGKSIAGLF